MAQKSGNHVKPPVNGGKGGKNDGHLHEQNLTDQHHGEHTDSLQDDKKIGQHNQTGRPSLMKK